MDELLRWREEFPILAKTTYLISNSLGAMPRAVYDRLHQYADVWATRGVRAWHDGWWEMAVDTGDWVGRLIGARPGEISLHQNVTIIQAIIASCFDLRGRRNKIVVSDLEFPSTLYFYLEQRRKGARVEVVRSPDSLRIHMDKFLKAIDERTLLVPISMVLFRSATIVDIRRILERARRVGAYVVLDLFQAAGTVPVDVRALNVDFATGGVLKWLCGGPGVAYLYVRSDLRRKLKPALTGWMADRQAFEFQVGAVNRRSDSFRFLNGTPHIPALYACQPGLEIISAVGVEAIRDKSIRQTARLIAGAESQGWRVNSPRDSAERGGTVSIDCPHAREVTAELLARDVLVDFRPKGGVRLSPHFYNRDEEIDFALEQMAQILAIRGWQSSRRTGSSQRRPAARAAKPVL
jgi:kynureninase